MSSDTTQTGRTFCTNGGGELCDQDLHDHRGQYESADNGTGIETDSDWLVCADCGKPMHYDYGDEAYHHDDPATPPCFLIRDEAVTA